VTFLSVDGDNVKMNLKETGSKCVDSIKFNQDRDQLRAVVNTVRPLDREFPNQQSVIHVKDPALWSYLNKLTTELGYYLLFALEII
jgi:hypothetical protein